MGQVCVDTNLDSAKASEDHAALIRGKRFLKEIYSEHYRFFNSNIDHSMPGQILELGSGGGFIKEVIPNAITSDVVSLSTTDMVVSATDMPFEDQSLKAILMVNVFHHIQDVGSFFNESIRCLKPAGSIIMIEPANTIFSRFIYKNFHHEPFVPEQLDWKLEEGGRMSVANDALPWIVFCRDRAKFERDYPQLKILLTQPYTPLRYIISGGVSKPQLVPSSLYRLTLGVESLLSPLNNYIGMFMKIHLRKTI